MSDETVKECLSCRYVIKLHRHISPPANVPATLDQIIEILPHMPTELQLHPVKLNKEDNQQLFTKQIESTNAETIDTESDDEDMELVGE